MNDSNRADNEQPLQLEEGLSHVDQLDGMWVYVCFRCIGSSGHMAAHHPPHIVHAPPSHNVSGTTDPPKKPKKYSTDNKPTLRVYCKSLTKYSLTIRDGKVTLAPTKPSDPHQHWIKEDKFGINVKDEKGHSSFALINKATGQAIKHSIGPTYPVQLIKYDPNKLDKSALWTLGLTREEGYRSIRAVYNIHLNLDAYDCTKDLERTQIRQYGWNGGSNQLWNLAFF